MDMLNGINIMSESLNKESKMGFFQMHQYSIVTSETSTKNTLKHIKVFLESQPDSHVSRSQSLANDVENKTNGICGPQHWRLFALLDHDSASWKMCQDSLLPLMGISEPSFRDWPKQGIMQDGACWVLTMWVPHIDESDCGFWPSPCAVDWKHSGTIKAAEAYVKSHHQFKITVLMQLCGFGQPHPEPIESVMGWPIGWTDLKPLGMGRFQEWLRLHGGF